MPCEVKQPIETTNNELHRVRTCLLQLRGALGAKPCADKQAIEDPDKECDELQRVQNRLLQLKDQLSEAVATGADNEEPFDTSAFEVKSVELDGNHIGAAHLLHARMRVWSDSALLLASPDSIKRSWSFAEDSTRENSPLCASDDSGLVLDFEGSGLVLDFEDDDFDLPALGMPAEARVKGRKRAAIKAFLKRSLFCVRVKSHN